MIADWLLIVLSLVTVLFNMKFIGGLSGEILA